MEYGQEGQGKDTIMTKKHTKDLGIDHRRHRRSVVKVGGDGSLSILGPLRDPDDISWMH